jgi:hypothetical protein
MALCKLPLLASPESEIFAYAVYSGNTADCDSSDSVIIRLMIRRKSNAKGPGQPRISFLRRYMRKRIVAAFGIIKCLNLKSIHAEIQKGLALKCILFIVAHSCPEKILQLSLTT